MDELTWILATILVTLMIMNIFLKSKDYFFISLFNFMNSLGAIYYVCGGYSYIPLNAQALNIVLITYIIVNLAYITYLVVRTRKGCSLSVDNPSNVQKNSRLYLCLFLIPPISYIVVFNDGFSLIQSIMGGQISESSRADVSGSLPFYYSFSVFLTSLAIPYCIDLYKRETNKWKYFAFGILLIFSLIQGEKSTLLTVLFYLYFFNSNKSSIKLRIYKIAIFGIAFLMFYSAVKYLYYGALGFDLIIDSIFRRVIVINTSLYGNFIDYFILNDGHIPAGFTHIKQFMFYYIYGYLPGGASVNFVGSILYSFKFGFFQIPLIFFITFYLLKLREAILTINISQFREAVTYLHFYGAIILVNGYISDFVIRVCLPMICFLILDKLSQIKLKSYSST